jgi:hypothetical protein
MVAAKVADVPVTSVAAAVVASGPGAVPADAAGTDTSVAAATVSHTTRHTDGVRIGEPYTAEVRARNRARRYRATIDG